MTQEDGEQAPHLFDEISGGLEAVVNDPDTNLDESEDEDSPDNEKKNPGAALGEAFGKALEEEVHNTLKELAEGKGFKFTGKSLYKGKSKLYLYSNSDVDYTIDGIIYKESENGERLPVLIFESKYLRWTKHNRDKASWMSNTYSGVGKAYPSITGSIAILFGRWSVPSLKMLKDAGVTPIVIPFSVLSEIFLLDPYFVDFDWKDKDKVKPRLAWKAFSKLKPEQIRDIAKKVVDHKREVIKVAVERRLDDFGTRGDKAAKSFKVIMNTNHGDNITLIETNSLEDIFSVDGSESKLEDMKNQSNQQIDEFRYRDLMYKPRKVAKDEEVAQDESEV